MEWVTKEWVILMKVSIKAKFISFICCLLATVIMLMGVLVLRGIKSYQKKETEELLANQKDMFEQYMDETFYVNKNRDELAVKREIKSDIFKKPWLRNIPAKLYDLDGKELQSLKINGKQMDGIDEKTMIDYALKDKMAYKEVNDTVCFFTPLKYNNETIAILELVQSVKKSNDFYNNTKREFLYVGIFALIIGAAIGMAYLLSITKYIFRMKADVENIQKGEYKKVEEHDRNDELGELSKGISFMSNTIQKNIEELNMEKDTLSLAVEKLEKMDVKQKEFLNSVTHEFKTPLTSIKAYADLLGMYKEDENLIEEAAENISKESERLAVMVDKVLSLAALEKYDFEIEKNQVELGELVLEECNRMKAKAEKNNLSLKCDVEGVRTYADAEGLRHVIVNLLDNAIKYNRPGGEIEARTYLENGHAYVVVSDTGIGIPKQCIDSIFEPFYRVKGDRSRKTGGTGLGLSLVKKLIEKQDGSISVKSKEGNGSSFIIELPECSSKRI